MQKNDSTFNIKAYSRKCFTKDGEEIFRGGSTYHTMRDDVVVILSPKERII